MERQPHAPRLAQEGAIPPGPLAGARRVNGHRWVPPPRAEGLPGCAGVGGEGLRAAHSRVCASPAGSPTGESAAQWLIPGAGRGGPGLEPQNLRAAGSPVEGSGSRVPSPSDSASVRHCDPG